MPQMAPLNWLTLLIYFLIVFFLINIMNYYNFNYKIKNSFSSKSLIKLNWKW
uniref:ATP synthase complex subunit 8 n=1 Tax=Coleoptera sp. ACP-2013 TaxID=2485033 RepID=A0A3G3MEJ3_9COLE|nr:ATP synthase F0 subunit 8 [Coleoptera sp. ACP-2013]